MMRQAMGWLVARESSFPDWEQELLAASQRGRRTVLMCLGWRCKGADQDLGTAVVSKAPTRGAVGAGPPQAQRGNAGCRRKVLIWSGWDQGEKGLEKRLS